MVKLVVYVPELICSCVAFYFYRQDLGEFTKSNSTNVTIEYVVGNKAGNATVNLEMFENLFGPYTLLFSLHVTVPIVYFLFYFRRFEEDVKSKYLWLVIAILIEMPLLFCNALFLVVRGVISSDLDEQMFDLLLHTMFILQAPIQFALDFVLWKREYTICIPFLLGFGFATTCVIYAPVSWRFMGIKGFKPITIDDYSGIVLDSDAENIMLILNNAGHIGQFLVIIIIIVLIVMCCCFCKGEGQQGGRSTRDMQNMAFELVTAIVQS